ncbi:helix-turn-helix domain-containing protein [Corynebacterium casei]|uniref:helix-turn-helix domain-containing protein n=1 Tax=Corynebacterium casei TaxID=160386 RepID=UPI003FD1ACB7
MSNNEPQKRYLEGKEWQDTIAEHFGNAVQAIRLKRGLSAAKLSDLTKLAGFHISRSTIAKIESNTRSGKIDVTELLVLSATLEVPPVLLIFPNYPDGRAHPLPGTETSSFDAVQWLSGEARMTGHPNVSYYPHPVEIVELAKKRSTLNDAFALLLQSKDDPEWITKTFELIEETDKQRNEINNQIREQGGLVGNGEG